VSASWQVCTASGRISYAGLLTAPSSSCPQLHINRDAPICAHVPVRACRGGCGRGWSAQTGGLLWPLCGWQCDSVWSHVHSRVSCMYGCSAQTPGCALFGVPGLIQGMSMQHCRTAKVVCVHDRRQHHQHRLCFSSTPPHSGRGMHLCACVVNAAGGVVCSVGRPQPPVCHQCHPKGGAV
jgi:hypothetical protein